MFELYKDKAGEFRFRLKAKNGQNILASEGYVQKASCIKGIESVKKNAQIEDHFDLQHNDKNDTWHFNLKSSNGQIVGTSQVYKSQEGAKEGIRSVTQNAPNADVKELE